jgi:hypothetical protein
MQIAADGSMAGQSIATAGHHGVTLGFAGDINVSLVEKGVGAAAGARGQILGGAIMAFSYRGARPRNTNRTGTMEVIKYCYRAPNRKAPIPSASIIAGRVPMGRMHGFQLPGDRVTRNALW